MPRGKNTFEDPVQHIAWQYGLKKKMFAKFHSHLWGGTQITRVLGIPGWYPGIPKTRQPYLEGIPISLGIWVRGYPKHGDTQITVTEFFEKKSGKTHGGWGETRRHRPFSSRSRASYSNFRAVPTIWEPGTDYDKRNWRAAAYICRCRVEVINWDVNRWVKFPAI